MSKDMSDISSTVRRPSSRKNPRNSKSHLPEVKLDPVQAIRKLQSMEMRYQNKMRAINCKMMCLNT